MVHFCAWGVNLVWCASYPQTNLKTEFLRAKVCSYGAKVSSVRRDHSPQQKLGFCSCSEYKRQPLLGAGGAPAPVLHSSFAGWALLFEQAQTLLAGGEAALQLVDMQQELADGFAKGVYWAVQNKDEFNIRVINCSIVFPTVIMTDPKTGAEFLCDPLAAAVKMATEAGISVVAGAGNFGSSQPIMTPACNSDVIAVGASDPQGSLADLSDDTVAPFSSFGKGMAGEIKPDILAPGVTKTAVVDRVLEMVDGTSETVLCIGDRGAWPAGVARDRCG